MQRADVGHVRRQVNADILKRQAYLERLEIMETEQIEWETQLESKKKLASSLRESLQELGKATTRKLKGLMVDFKVDEGAFKNFATVLTEGDGVEALASLSKILTKLGDDVVTRTNNQAKEQIALSSKDIEDLLAGA